MAIVNVEFQRRFFWDTRANSIESQVLMPIEHPIEMGMNLDSLVYRLQRIPYYPPLFEAAFGDTVITISRIAKGLGQFMKSIRSYESKYDRGLANDFAEFTDLENAGRTLWFSGEHSCTNCHITPNFGGVSSHVNGLNAGGTGDPGVGGVTGDDDDMGRFKTVSLRNIGLTAPYMHDGRFETLEEVISFYSTEIQPHPYLDDRLATDNNIGGPPKEFNLTEHQIAAYVAFLNTLTDWHLVENPIYADPFEE
jgi:cytochrome c peroxidase